MAVGEHQQETMVEQEENNDILACQVQTGDSHQVSVEAVWKVAQECAVEEDGQPISMVAKSRTVGHLFRFPPTVKSFIYSDAVNWMRHGGLGSGFLIAAVGVATFVAVTVVVTIALLFISSSLNAAVASFFVAISTVGFLMAFFFSSITVVYVAALGFGGLTIGSIAFFSVWAVIILSGWMAIAWVIWQGLRRVFQFVRHLAFLAGCFLVSFPAAQKLQLFGAKYKEYQQSIQVHKFKEYRYSPLKLKKMAMD